MNGLAGCYVSTIGKPHEYFDLTGSPDRRNASHRWATFVRNHAKAVVAADFFNVVTVSFRVLYVFVIMEIGTRKMLPFNVTAHPTARRVKS